MLDESAELRSDEPVCAPVRRSRFDRPKPPHDWRWALGGAGRVLVSTGILTFLFIAYQLWGTALQTLAEQRDRRSEFETALETAVTLPRFTATTLPATTTEVPLTSDPPTVATLAGETASTVETAGTQPLESSTTAPSTTVLPTLPPALGPPPPSLATVGELEIPSIGAKDIVVQGVTRDALQDGPGHFPETPLPGQFGNAVIAGHRTTYAQPFADVDDIEPGDEIIVTIVDDGVVGRWVYIASETLIVEPDDYAEVVGRFDAGNPTLTLVSCHPYGQATQRIVVRAVLDQTQSSIVTEPWSASPPAEGGTLPDG